MILFGEQNGPFCEVKWLILKIGKIFPVVLFVFFTPTKAIVHAECKKTEPVFWVRNIYKEERFPDSFHRPFNRR